MKVVLGLLVTFVILVLTFIPTWIFLGVRYFASPEGFWQNLAVAGIGLWFLGGAQMVFLICGLALVLSAWTAIYDGR